MARSTWGRGVWALAAAAALAGAFPAAASQNEFEIGRAAARNLEQRYGLYTDPAANARLQRIARLVVRASGSPAAFRFRILKGGEPNGITLPGGFIFLTQGLMKLLPEDELLAAALAHEVAHITLGHMTQMLQEQQVAMRAQAAGALPGSGTAGMAGPGVQPVELPAHVREKAADRAAARCQAAAGLDPASVARLLGRLSKQPELNAIGSLTHPTWEDRIRTLETYLRSPQFEADTRLPGFARRVEPRGLRSADDPRDPTVPGGGRVGEGQPCESPGPRGTWPGR
ncbi:MAG: M48 family metalloprotease [Armatimonadetes bacterium]|nr:M48 family metalloprotease [Armatimonadota bacterium]